MKIPRLFSRGKNQEQAASPDVSPGPPSAPAPDVPGDLAGTGSGEPEPTSPSAVPSPAPGKKRFSLSRKSGKKSTIRTYQFAEAGPLLHAQASGVYKEIERYWVDPGRSLVIIARNTKTSQNEYLLFEPELSPFEYELLERLYADLRNVLVLGDEDLEKDRSALVLEKLAGLLAEYGVHPEQEGLFRIEYFLLRNFIGWGRIDALMKDPYLEDISCDGNMIPIFLYHRKYRNVRTNILFQEEELNSLAISLAQRSGKHISSGTPMIDATLPEGSRLQLTLGTEVTTRGTSFTIRKFREEPFSPIELMELGTFNSDELAYFWIAIENNRSLIFIGGTASGKTTSLNAVSLFIPPVAKVVSIEDTREITLFHENWIASVTREAVAEGTSTITMFDLLRSAMRQRPEYILVGEVRGHEAQTLFQAMNTGHTTFSTMHAGNVDAAIHRLESEPLNVPKNMLQALNIVSVQALVYRGTERIRRALEIVEIAGMDPGTGNIRVNTVFTYDPVQDTFSFSGRSQVYAQIAEQRGWSREQFEREIGLRKQILEALHTQGIRDYISVSRIFQAYQIDPAQVVAAMGDLKVVLT